MDRRVVLPVAVVVGFYGLAVLGFCFPRHRQAYALPSSSTAWEVVDIEIETTIRVNGRHHRTDVIARRDLMHRNVDNVYTVMSKTREEEVFHYVVLDPLGAEHECYFAGDLPTRFKPHCSYGHPRAPNISASIIDADTGLTVWRKS